LGKRYLGHSHEDAQRHCRARNAELVVGGFALKIACLQRKRPTIDVGLDRLLDALTNVNARRGLDYIDLSRVDSNRI
jgi:hypothetical protein